MFVCLSVDEEGRRAEPALATKKRRARTRGISATISDLEERRREEEEDLGDTGGHRTTSEKEDTSSRLFAMGSCASASSEKILDITEGTPRDGGGGSRGSLSLVYSMNRPLWFRGAPRASPKKIHQNCHGDPLRGMSSSFAHSLEEGRVKGAKESKTDVHKEDKR